MFDYVRFPSDGDLAAMVFGQPGEGAEGRDVAGS